MSSALWKVAQVTAVVATAALVAGLFLAPHTSLVILWSVLIPLVPASLLVTPKAWRNVCPLATLNMWTSRRATRPSQGPRFTAVTHTLGIILLATLVPARHFVFNTNGPALATTVIAVCVAALVLGAFLKAKAGFCNALCPVLPVERLYGQSPLLTVGNPRCRPCTLCARACLDISPRKSVPQIIGRARHDASWLRTPFGVFAAAFPGFVIGYFTASDGPLSAATSIYLHVGAWSLGSYVLTTLVVVGGRISSAILLPALAALAVGFYYWFAAPGMVTPLGGGSIAAAGVRVVALALVGVWWWKGRSLKNGR